jgi:hypothetical protein
MGQQKINKTTPDHPSLRKWNRLNEAADPAAPRVRERPASTFNPKVAGSIPARPMRLQGFCSVEARLRVHAWVRAFVRTHPSGFSSLQLVAARARLVAGRCFRAMGLELLWSRIEAEL